MAVDSSSRKLFVSDWGLESVVSLDLTDPFAPEIRTVMSGVSSPMSLFVSRRTRSPGWK